MIQSLWKTVWRFLKKLGIKPPYDPAIPLLGIYPEETKLEKHMYPILHCSTIYNSTLMLGKIEGRRRGQQRMRWLDGIKNTMDMGLGGLREFVMDREAWHIPVHGVTKSWT